MLSKGPTPEQVEGDESGEDGDISEKTAGPSYKAEEEVEDAPEAGAEDEEDSLVERRTPRQTDDDEEDNTLSLAQMEAALNPQALATFATITSLFKIGRAHVSTPAPNANLVCRILLDTKKPIPHHDST